jgi:hypothetical protein
MTKSFVHCWRVTVGEGVGALVKSRHVKPAGTIEEVHLHMVGFESTKGGWEVPLDMQACLLEAND